MKYLEPNLRVVWSKDPKSNEPQLFKVSRISASTLPAIAVLERTLVKLHLLIDGHPRQLRTWCAIISRASVVFRYLEDFKGGASI